MIQDDRGCDGFQVRHISLLCTPSTKPNEGKDGRDQIVSESEKERSVWQIHHTQSR